MEDAIDALRADHNALSEAHSKVTLISFLPIDDSRIPPPPRVSHGSVHGLAQRAKCSV
jgi:hypothetical protein